MILKILDYLKKSGKMRTSSKVSEFDAPIQFADWVLINASVLLTAEIERTGPEDFDIKFQSGMLFHRTNWVRDCSSLAKTSNWRRLHTRLLMKFIVG